MGQNWPRCKFNPQTGGGFLVAAVLWGTFRWPAAPHDVTIGPVEFPPPHFLRIGFKRNNISNKPADTSEFPHVVAPSAPSWLLCVLGIVKGRLQNKNVNTQLPWKYSRIFQEQNLHSNWLKIQSLGAFGCSMPFFFMHVTLRMWKRSLQPNCCSFLLYDHEYHFFMTSFM